MSETLAVYDAPKTIGRPTDNYTLATNVAGVCKAIVMATAQNIQGRTICAFGEACAWPVLSYVKKFKDDFEAKGAADEAKAAAAKH